jgi:zinc protease
MKTAELKGWVTTHLRPDRAVALVGGDITLAEIQPLLEARLGSWKPRATPVQAQPTGLVIRQPEKTTIYLVDKPGSSQSVIRVGRPVGSRTDPDEAAFEMANDAVGGMFTARVNLNLREDKGYTYGARSWTLHSYVPDLWILSTSVRADATAASLTEIMKELRGASGDRPLSQDELDKAKGNALGTFPVDYETPGDLLGGLSELWRYGLPDDWLKTTPDRVRAVTLDAANASWKKYMDPGRLDIIVVGDASSIREGITGLGIPVVELNRDGEPIKGK